VPSSVSRSLLVPTPPSGYANIDMVDKLVEDITEVTETLMTADEVDLQAFAHPTTMPTLNERHEQGEHWVGWGEWKKQKAAEHRAKMEEQRQTGVFKRGVC